MDNQNDRNALKIWKTITAIEGKVEALIEFKTSTNRQIEEIYDKISQLKNENVFFTEKCHFFEKEFEEVGDKIKSLDEKFEKGINKIFWTIVITLALTIIANILTKFL